MKVGYFDCFAGASGDMIVGALLDRGLDLESLKRAIGSLNLGGVQLSVDRVKRCGIAATKFDVKASDDHQPHRRLSDIKRIISGGDLSERVKTRALAAFQAIAEAEAQVHGTSVEEVHFHEVGAVDSIVDVVCAMLGVEMLSIDQFVSSPLRVGRGIVKTEHGVLPVPAPATALILRGVPTYGGDEDGEFVTPTGAAILKTLCHRFEPAPMMRVTNIGYGAGTKDPAGFPNTLRFMVGEVEKEFDTTSQDSSQTVCVIEANIDDMNPQVCGYLMDRAFAAGARDVYFTPTQMKKSRPGILLTIVCDETLLDALTQLVLEETTTLGIRYHKAQRRILSRRMEKVSTPYGEVRVKVAFDRDRTLHFQPEYEDCAALATALGVSLIEVQSAANAAFRKKSAAED